MYAVREREREGWREKASTRVHARKKVVNVCVYLCLQGGSAHGKDLQSIMYVCVCARARARSLAEEDGQGTAVRKAFKVQGSRFRV
jgi:hypothetical protein